MEIVRKILRITTIAGLSLCVFAVTFLVGGKFGNDGSNAKATLTGVPFADADAPAAPPPAPAPTTCGGSCSGGSCGCN